MAVNIGEIQSEVIASGSSEPAGAAAPAAEREWEQSYRFRLVAQRLAADRLRTQAEGFDD